MQSLFISIDLDAFYCGVEEHEDSSLRGKPFCVVQKHVIATLSYEARALGIQKLANINTVKRDFPDLITVNGEDLTKYRTAGKMLYNWVRELVGGEPVERLGLEEMRLDLSPSIRINRNRFPEIGLVKEWLQDPDFCDEVVGCGVELLCGENRVKFPNFYFSFEGNTWPPNQEQLEQTESLETYIAGNIAQYIRDRMWLELGYSCSIGVASSKTYAKIACALNKPRGVTVLVPGHEAEFMRTLKLASIPGLGRATRKVLGSATTVSELLENFNQDSFVKTVSAVLGAKSAASLWLTILGQEPTEVGQVIQDYSLPKQVSVEESYHEPCARSRWRKEVGRLVKAVLIQTRIDCFDEHLGEWLAVPSTMRVAVIFPKTGESRKSRSARISWSRTPPTSVETQLALLLEALVPRALRLLEEVAVKTLPRVINVALAMDQVLDQ